MQSATKRSLLLIAIGAATASAQVAHATCWSEASTIYGIPVDVLKAVAKTESGFNPGAVNRNKDGSRDLGLMQINTGWLPTLRQHGITETELSDPCVNLKVGAWVLSTNAQKLGWNWNAIGAYNVGCAKLNATECERRRNSYAWKIHAALRNAPVAVYQDSAPAASSSLIRASSRPTPGAGKIMMIAIAAPEQRETRAAGIEAGHDDADVSLIAMNVGSFLSYEGVRDE